MERKNAIDGQNEVALTEPVIVRNSFLTGTAVEAAAAYVRIVGWEQLPDVGGEMQERRINLRASMPTAVARVLMTQLRDALAKAGH